MGKKYNKEDCSIVMVSWSINSYYLNKLNKNKTFKSLKFIKKLYKPVNFGYRLPSKL